MTEQERELDLALADAMEEIHELKHVIDVERLAQKDMANTLNNYERLIRDLTDALRANPDRNAVLEEVAIDFDKMTALGDTAASFAAFIRSMKK